MVEDYGGDAERVWREAGDGAELRKRIAGLPGFGEMKMQGARRGALEALRRSRPREELDAGPPDARRRGLGAGARGLPGEEARVQGEAARSELAARAPILSVRVPAAAVAVVFAALSCAGGSAYALRVPGAPKCTVFPKTNPWNRRVDRLPVASTRR